jgi:hypothetical protein
MRFVLIAIFLALPFVRLSGENKGATRTVIYDTQRNYSVMVLVSVSDSPSGLSGEVTVVPIRGGNQRSVPLHITRSQFEKIWSSFLSSGIDQYPIEKARQTIDLDYYYVFMSGGRKYAVPKNKASPVTATLARQMEVYANDKAVGLQNLPKRVPSNEPERVIIH